MKNHQKSEVASEKESERGSLPTPISQPSKVPVTKSQVIKDTFVFQVKLFGDGMRDVFLSPVSITAAVAGIILSPSKPDKYLRKLMAFGHKTDRWLNLFGTYGHHANTNKKTSDNYVKKVEEILIKDYREGGVTKVVKESTDKLVSATQNEVSNVKSAVKKPPTQ